jgi:adenylosuccinate synthase
LAPLACDTVTLIHEQLDAKKNILFEGAQGTLLDIDFGTYPFVTSSNCFSGGMMSGSGVPPTVINEVTGIFKAYCTRVGAGPFTSELTDAVGEELRKKGSEFGATTGRPRRCGWFDAVAGRFSARINGLTEIVMTKLDILTGFDEIPVCIAYECDGKRLDTVPTSLDILKRATPIYESVPGWQEDISDVRKFEDLPVNAQAYVKHIEKLVNVHISIVSVGPDREAIIQR